MSASDKKRQRKAEAATMTPRQKAAKKEARSLKMYTWSFWIIIILCAALTAGMLLYNPVDGMIRGWTTAIQVGDHSLSAVELNYFYVDEINTYCQNYSSYLSYILDTSKSIGDQFYDETNKVTWADYFLDNTIESIKDTYALYDAAQAAKFELSEEEKSELKTLKDNLKTYATYYQFGSTNDYLVSIYGNGANETSYMKYYEIVKIANAYHDAYGESLKENYTPAQLREYEKDTPYKFNSYSYVSFLLSLDKFKTGGVKDDKGNLTYTDEQMAQFREALKKAAEDLSSKDNNTLEKLNAAIKELEISLTPPEDNKDTSSTPTTAPTTTPTTEPTTAPTTEPTTEPTTDSTSETTSAPTTDATTAPTTKPSEDKKEPTYSTATDNKDKLYTSIGNPQVEEWLRDSARKAGDITMIANEVKEVKDGKEVKNVNGYYIVIFNGVNTNEYHLVNVRHVLISYESATGSSTYTEAEKKAAKDKAQKLLDEWKKNSDLSEASFAELAKKNSKDNAEDGGLYEDVYPGQMVQTFNDWCFEPGRVIGDYGIVETQYGCHIMYYVGTSDIIYRDHLITNAKQAEDVSAWKAGLLEKMVVEKKNVNFIDRDMKLSAQNSY